MEQENFIKNLVLKFLHVMFLSLALQKLPPGTKQISNRNDILIFIMATYLPVIAHAAKVYRDWYQFRDHLPKKFRCTLGDKIDSLFIEILELLFTASYQNIESKLPTIETAIKKTDVLKFFLQIAWDIQALDDKKYILLSEQTQELGRMVGGWKRQLLTKTPI